MPLARADTAALEQLLLDHDIASADEIDAVRGVVASTASW
jgi:hypothetical protein